jgi:hypothetical protein
LPLFLKPQKEEKEEKEEEDMGHLFSSSHFDFAASVLNGFNPDI